MKISFVIRTEDIKRRVVEAIRSLSVDHPHKVSIRPESLRTLEQNSKMWAMLTDVAKQVCWYGQYLSKESWKDVLTAGLKKQTAVPGIDGGFVVIGARTSKMSIKEMVDLITLAYAFGQEQEVKWSEKSKKTINQLELTPNQKE